MLISPAAACCESSRAVSEIFTVYDSVVELGCDAIVRFEFSKADGFHLALGRIKGNFGQGGVIIVTDPLQKACAGVECVVQGFKRHIVFCNGFGRQPSRRVIGISKGDGGVIGGGSDDALFRQDPPRFVKCQKMTYSDLHLRNCAFSLSAPGQSSLNSFFCL